MSLFIRDDIPVRRLGKLYKKRNRILAYQALDRFCWRERIGGQQWFVYKTRRDIEQLYLKGA